MSPHRTIKFIVFSLEGLNSFGTVFYFNYLYFWMRDTFGFGDKLNLALAASLGLVYMFSAWQTGKFAQRRGYYAALKTGYVIMALALAAGLGLSVISHRAWEEVVVAILVTLGMCFIWPTLEAFVSDGETAERLPRIVGIYNVVWALTAALAYFTGGGLIKAFGYRIIFALPLGIVLGMFALVLWLQRLARDTARQTLETPSPSPPKPHQPASPKARIFLRMAWLANPFAYVAIQTLVAIIPGIAAKFQLSPMAAGFACTLWYFVRVAAFIVLWQWPGWHYRFHWLAGSFVMLVVSFAAICMAPSLAALVFAQIFLGAAIGLIYYSSLFYSMDAGDTKGEHGGIHEAAIGMGNCVGPAIGAVSLQFLPQYPGSAGTAVSILLLGGFAALLTIWKLGNRAGQAVKTIGNVR